MAGALVQVVPDRCVPQTFVLGRSVLWTMSLLDDLSFLARNVQWMICPLFIHVIAMRPNMLDDSFDCVGQNDLRFFSHIFNIDFKSQDADNN
jgi:hypothetical protein